MLCGDRLLSYAGTATPAVQQEKWNCCQNKFVLFLKYALLCIVFSLICYLFFVLFIKNCDIWVTFAFLTIKL